MPVGSVQPEHFLRKRGGRAVCQRWGGLCSTVTASRGTAVVSVAEEGGACSLPEVGGAV